MGLSCSYMLQALPAEIILVFEVFSDNQTFSFITNRYVRDYYATNTAVVVTVGTLCVAGCLTVTVVNLVVTHRRIKVMKRNKRALQ